MRLCTSQFSQFPKKTHLSVDQWPRRRGGGKHREEDKGREGGGEDEPRGRGGGAGHLFLFLLFLIFHRRGRSKSASSASVSDSPKGPSLWSIRASDAPRFVLDCVYMLCCLHLEEIRRRRGSAIHCTRTIAKPSTVARGVEKEGAKPVFQSSSNSPVRALFCFHFRCRKQQTRF